MKYISTLSTFILFICLNTGFSQSTSTIELMPFDEIELDISANVTVKQGKTQKVEVSGPQELIDLLNKEIKGSTWEVKYTKRNVKNVKKLEITITVPHLKEVNLNGSGDIRGSSAWHEDEMEIDINGSGSVFLEVYVEDLELSINGSGDLNISGTAKKLEADINGSGDIKAEDLTTEYAEFGINGSGDSKIHVTKKLDATINGSGDIHYLGEPDLKIRKNGSGTVKNMNS